MRRIVIALMGTVSGVVLLFSYHTSTRSSVAVAGSDLPTTTPGDGTTSNAPDPAASIPSSDSSSSSSSSSSSAGSVSGTFTGAAAQTRWGTVQVRITVSAGRITQSEAIQYPQNNPRDVQINAYALPQLSQEVLQRQSASIDAISGATVTSGGYLESLQSAIDQAHL